MGIAMDAANALEAAIDAKIAKAAPKRTRAVGTVTRVDADGTSYVKLDGSDYETPVKYAAAAVEPDEEVTVTISNGSMSIDGNYSRPATDDTTARAAQETANNAINSASEAAIAAASAISSAETAASAAAAAQTDAAAASSAASTAQTQAAAAVTAAGQASTAAATAQASADAANNSLKSVVSGATTVEKAVSVMQTALEAVVDYDPDTDTTTEYFWHDANGAHVLGDTSGYRNDIDSTGMTIVDVNTERSAAHFGADGATIGKVYDAQALDNESHMELDYHSMSLIDRQNFEYFQVKDLRGSDGIATVTEEIVIAYEPDISGSDVEVYLSHAYISLNDASAVLYNTGYETESIEAVSGSAYAVVCKFPSSATPTVGQTIAVTYRTTEPVYGMSLGNPLGSMFGTGSASFGDGEARGTASFAHGRKLGYDEAGWDDIGPVASGSASSAEGISTLASGEASHAEGRVRPYVPQGSIATAYQRTEASGDASHAEGYGTVASGEYSHTQNYGTQAGYASQTAIGRFNANSRNNALEIGNGWYDHQRSNALAVEWNGNVRIAGEVQDMSGSAKYTGMATSSHSASSVSIAAGANYYLNLGSVAQKTGYVPIAVVVDVSGMSNYDRLNPSTLQTQGTYIWSRVYNTGSSASTGTIAATVYWLKA